MLGDGLGAVCGQAAARVRVHTPVYACFRCRAVEGPPDVVRYGFGSSAVWKQCLLLLHQLKPSTVSCPLLSSAAGLSSACPPPPSQHRKTGAPSASSAHACLPQPCNIMHTYIRHTCHPWLHRLASASLLPGCVVCGSSNQTKLPAHSIADNW